MKNVKYDFDNQYKEVRIVIDSLTELVNQETSFEKVNNEFTEISRKFFKMMYAVSSSGLFQSENGGGDVLRDRKYFTDMEKLKFRRNCRDWTQIREDFEKQVENVIKDEATVSYAPRNASPDNILWRCLEERKN